MHGLSLMFCDYRRVCVGVAFAPALQRRHLARVARFYGRVTITATANADSVIGPFEIDDPRVQSVIGDATTAERDEAAIEETTSGVYVGLTPDGTPAAACSWRVWPHRVAHMSVLTAASHRGSGYGASTSLVALDAATGAGLLPTSRSAQLRTGPAVRVVGRQGSISRCVGVSWAVGGV